MTEPVKQTTVVFPRRNEKILLGMKKRGFGEGWWNGFGGKLEPGETFEGSARRETREEVGIDLVNLKIIAYLLFYFDDVPGIACVAYTSTNFLGTPIETEEMRPKWFDSESLPYETMWPGDEDWIPEALSSNSLPLYRSLYFTSDNTYIRTREESTALIGEYFET